MVGSEFDVRPPANGALARICFDKLVEYFLGNPHALISTNQLVFIGIPPLRGELHANHIVIIGALSRKACLWRKLTAESLGPSAGIMRQSCHFVGVSACGPSRLRSYDPPPCECPIRRSGTNSGHLAEKKLFYPIVERTLPQVTQSNTKRRRSQVRYWLRPKKRWFVRTRVELKCSFVVNPISGVITGGSSACGVGADNEKAAQ